MRNRLLSACLQIREHARSELCRQRPWNPRHRSPFGQRLSLDRECTPKLQPRGSVELALGPIGVP